MERRVLVRSRRAAAARALASLVLLAGAWLALTPGGAPAAPLSEKAASAPATAPAPAVTDAEIDRAIIQLSDDDWRVREKATQWLWRAGKPAENALRKAAGGTDPETVSRANGVLEKFRYGIFPDTPKAVIELVEQYRAADTRGKIAVAAKLLELGRPAYRSLIAMSASEEPATRRTVFAQFEAKLAKIVGAILVEDPAEAQSILESGALSGGDAALRNWAAYMLLTGKLDDRITRFGSDPGQAQSKMLTYLYRAKGDLKGAAKAAALSGDRVLLENIQFEMGDWAALAKGPLASIPGEERTGFLSAFQRLSGDKEGMEKSLKTLREQAASNSEDQRYMWAAVKALFVNDRPGDAIEVLRAHRADVTAFELLVGQGRYEDALALHKDAVGAPRAAETLDDFNLKAARAFCELGEKDKALGLFTALCGKYGNYGNDGEDDGNPNVATAALARVHPALLAVITSEAQVGLADQAAQQVAKIFARRPDVALLQALYPGRDLEAMLWGTYSVDEAAAHTGPARFERVRRILNGEMPKAELAALVATLRPEKHGLQPNAEQSYLIGMVETCQHAGLVDEAVACLDAWRDATAGTATAPALVPPLAEPDEDDSAEDGAPDGAGGGQPAPAQAARAGLTDQLAGDVLSKAKRWPEALARYEAVCKVRPGDPIPEFLRGYVLIQMGKEADGRKAIDRASLWVLANEPERSRLARVMAQCGMKAEARKQEEILVRTAEPFSLVADHVMQSSLAWRELEDKNFAQAALYQQRSLLNVLHQGVTMTQPSGYLQLTAWAHGPLFEGALAAGDLDKAAAELDICRELMPGGIDPDIRFVQAADAKGKKEQADKVFQRAWDFHAAIIAKHPKAANELNASAWLAARCRRNLDEARKCAESAVAAQPDSVGLLDTLAEVRFQQGDSKSAVELMTKCLEMDKKKPGKLTKYLQGQLKRFEAGDNKTDPPEEPRGEED
jgi:hypothetical protein